MKEKYLIFSDCHGAGKELEELIRPFVETYNIISGGDNFDRSFDGIKVWELIQKYNILSVRGNHEQKILDYLEGRRDHAPRHYYYFLNEFSKQYNLQDLVDWLKNLPLIIKINDNTLVAHGGIVPHNPWQEDISANVYGRYNNSKNWYEKYKGEVTVIFGHKVFPTPFYMRNHRGYISSIGIDTGAVHGGKLTGVEIIGDTVKIHQVQSKDYYSKMKQMNVYPNKEVLKFHEKIRTNEN